MIRPDMATMLGFVATDAAVSRARPRTDLLERVADRSFNCITRRRRHVDQRLASSWPPPAQGPARASRQDLRSSWKPRSPTSRAASRRRSCATARARPSSSPCASSAGAARDECRKVAYAIAHSPLVKTAFFASDPNLGRILAAIGYAGVRRSTPRRSTSTSTTCWSPSGGGRHPALQGRAGRRGDEEARVHRARGAQPRQGRGHRVDLRLLVRLRENQRRVPRR